MGRVTDGGDMGDRERERDLYVLGLEREGTSSKPLHQVARGDRIPRGTRRHEAVQARL